MIRKRFVLHMVVSFAMFLIISLLFACTSNQGKRPNVLLITVDDMNFDTPGCFGGDKNMTPNIDRLAAQGMRFERAHVALAICQASRQCLMTGRYPHNAGFRWFEPVAPEVPILTELLHKEGYINACFGKAEHLQPRERYRWDESMDLGQLNWGRDPAKYYELCKSFIQKAKSEKKPFFLMANSHDPHRPFHNSDDEAEVLERLAKKKVNFATPSQVFCTDEALDMGFMPYIPEVKKQTAQYMSSCRRADDTVGEILRALKESGEWNNTVIFFLSDNGSAFPFAKGNVYVNGTRTPLIACWEGHIRAGSVNKQDYINGIDFMPTVLDILGLIPPEKMDGHTFDPLLKGKKQEGRNSTVTTFYNVYPVAGGRKPELTEWFEMRCLHHDGYGYIYNSWTDGNKRFTPLARPKILEQMKLMGYTERENMFRYRCPEEFYHDNSDPDALNNLIDSTEHKDKIQEMRIALFDWMKKNNDTDLLSEFQVVAEQKGFNENVPRGKGYEHIKPVAE
jgi:N-sulfoglucosamine sulfohydrolase